MDIQDFKRWHWMVIGVLAGLALSFAFSDHDLATDSAWRDKEIKQPEFEQAAYSRSRDSHEPVLQNVVVEPPIFDYLKHAKQIVHGDRLRFSPKYKQEYRDPFFFYADSPYVPQIVPAVADPAAAKNVKSVMDFLGLAKSTLALPAAPATARPWQAATPLRFRFAWEYQSNWNIVLWAGGGLLVLGGIWPTFLNLLVGAGLGGAPKPKLSEEEAYLSRFGNGKTDAPKAAAATADHDGERRQLDELNAALEASLTPTGTHPPASAPVAAATPAIRKLESGGNTPAVVSEAEPEPEISEEERLKRFAAGSFYPVARGPAKKT